MSWLRPAALIVLAGCLGQLGCLTGVLCESDAECDGAGECTRTGECVLAGTALRVTVSWTIEGEAPAPSSPAPCEQVEELEVLFHDPHSVPQTYRPVPCELGRTVYDKMPPRFDSVEVVAYGRDGRVLDSAERPLAESGETDVVVDLVP